MAFFNGLYKINTVKKLLITRDSSNNISWAKYATTGVPYMIVWGIIKTQEYIKPYRIDNKARPYSLLIFLNTEFNVIGIMEYEKIIAGPKTQTGPP